MLASIFGVTGLIVWIVVIVAVIALLKGKTRHCTKAIPTECFVVFVVELVNA